MTPSPDEAARRWLAQRATRELERDLFAQADIDEIFDEPPLRAVEVGLQCLIAGLREARRTYPDLDAVLTIPLPDSDFIVMESPTLSDLFEQSWAPSPGGDVVGLYLVRPVLWSAYEEVEEYRKHLPSEGLLPDGFAAYYRVWRPAVWDEYTRTIYIRTTQERV